MSLLSHVQQCWSSEVLHQARTGQHLAFTTTRFPNTCIVLLKEKVMQHIGKHVPIPTFLKHVAGVKKI